MGEFSSEAEMARILVSWLHEQRWEVYQEVQVVSYGCVADIIAVRHGVVWAIETKRNMSLALMGQALHWLRRAHYTSVATPSKRHSVFDAPKYFLEKEGIGWLIIVPDGVHERLQPKLRRKSRVNWITDKLTEDHKTFAEAGSSSGQHYTPYKDTCRNLRAFVERHSGCTLKELIESVTHHYASMTSARSAIAKWAQMGKIPGIRCEREGKFLRFYPTEAEG